jgi:hypothetical protein
MCAPFRLELCVAAEEMSSVSESNLRGLSNPNEAVMLCYATDFLWDKQRTGALPVNFGLIRKHSLLVERLIFGTFGHFSSYLGKSFGFESDSSGQA